MLWHHLVCFCLLLSIVNGNFAQATGGGICIVASPRGDQRSPRVPACGPDDFGDSMLVPQLVFRNGTICGYDEELSFAVRNVSDLEAARYLSSFGLLGNSSLQVNVVNSTAPVLRTWNTSNSQITGQCARTPCPVIDRSRVPREHWSLCGGCAYVSRAVCPNYEMHWSLSVFGSASISPRFAGRNCTKQPCQVTEPGCFEPYATISECVVSTGAPSCSMVPTDASRAMSNCEYYTSPGYCPSLPLDSDPIYCTKNGKYSSACTRRAYEGLPVDGDSQYCRLTTCSRGHSCKCRVVDVQFSLTVRDTSPIPAFISAGTFLVRPSVFVQENDICRVTGTRPVKTGVQVEISGNTTKGRMYSEHYTIVLDFAESTFAKVPVELQNVAHKYCVDIPKCEYVGCFYHHGTTGCERYLDDFADIMDTNCFTSTQEFFFYLGIATLSFVGLVFLVFFVAAFVAILISYVSMRKQRKLERSLSETEEKLTFSSKLGRILLGLVMLSMVCGTSAQTCVAELKCSGTCEFTMDDSSRTLCLPDGSVLHYSKFSYTDYQRMHYYTFSVDSHVVSHLRCGTNGNCGESSCAQLASSGAPVDAYGQITNEEALLMPGKTSCFRVCESPTIGSDILDCGCFYVKPNCLYSRFWMTKKDTYMVSGLSSRHEALKVIRTYPNGTTLTYSTHEDSEISIRAVHSTEDLYSRDYCLVRGPSDRIYETCSQRGSPIKGEIGEIQSVTVDDDLVDFSRETVIWDEDMLISWTAGEKDSFPVISSQAIDSANIKSLGLPHASFFNSVDLVPGALIFSFYQNLPPVRVLYKRDTSIVKHLSCPEICEVSDSSFCATCGRSNLVTASIRSTCGDGSASVYLDGCSSVTPSTVSLTGECVTYQFICEGEVGKRGDRTMRATGLTEDASEFSVEIFTDKFTQENTTVPNRIMEEGARDDSWYNPLSWFTNVFNGLGNWFDWLMLVISLIILSAIVLAALFCTWKLFIWYRKAKMEYIETSIMEPEEEMQEIEVPNSFTPDVQSPSFKWTSS